MYTNHSAYTWWDIEDGVTLLAAQAVARWESLRLPKDATEHPVMLQVWMTRGSELVYTLSLFHGTSAVYTAEGNIEMSGASLHAATAAAELEIFNRASDLVGESIAEKLVQGLLAWLR